MKRLLVAGLIMGIVFHVSGQSTIPNLEFALINIEHGLSHGTVNVIFKDKQGYMWFGTGDGLNRYDGHTFKVFKENTLKIGSYRGNYPRTIVEDSEGIIWVGTNKGLHRYNPETEVIEFIPITGIENGIAFINDIELDEAGQLWIACSAGLFSYDIQQERFVVYNRNNIEGFEFRSLFALEIISSNQMFIATDSELLHINTEQKSVTRIPTDKNVGITDLAFDQTDKKLWLATRESGLLLWDVKSETMIRFGKEDGLGTQLLRELFLDSKGRLWIGTDGAGLNLFNPETRTFRNYKLENGNERSLSSNAVLSILVEDNNVVWVGTYSAGINHFSPYRYKFKHLQNQQESENSLSHNHVISINHSKNKGLWIGTDGGGVDYLDLKSNSITAHFNNRNLPYYDQTIVLDMLEDSRQNLWLTTYPGQVFKYNPETKITTEIPTNPSMTNEANGLPSSFVWSLMEDSNDNIWFTTSLPASITRYNPIQNQFYSYGSSGVDKMDCDYVFDVEEGSDGNIWAGTDQHLYRLDIESKEFTEFIADGTTKGLADQFINDLYFDKSGTLWIATYNGLSKMLDDQSFKTYRTTDGLPNDLVSSIIQDEAGQFWVATNQGLSLFDPEKETFQNYGVKDGLGGISFKARSTAKTADGSLYFGGTHGISVVNPTELMFDQRQPVVKLSRLSIFNQEVLPNQEGSPLQKSISQQKSIELNHKQSVFSIEYTALDFIAPENNQFAYRLIGLEEEWNYVGNRRIATYTSLSPGQYIFQVKATNHDGIWNETPLELSIMVLPPWYNTWVARISYLILVFLAIYLFIRVRLGFLEKQRTKLELLVKEKTEELANSNHELTTANDALIDANTRLMEKTEELENTLTNLKDTQTKLVQSEKMASLGTLTAGVGHEINNPLNFIKGGVEGISHLLQDQEPLDEDKAHRFINIVKEGVKRASMIVKSLSHFSHRSDGMSEECDIHSVLENCLVILGGKLNGKVLVQKNYHEEPILVLCNEGRLHQAFLNLLANAEQAIDQEGEIVITTMVNTKNFSVAIRDTGTGIEKKNLERIMDPFFTTKAPGKGTGLGLSITYNIIKEHHGNIHVDSEVGIGTTFTVQLPVSSSK